MSGFKGTRGKWRLVESTCGLITESQCISIRVGEDDIITVWDFSEESQANALLISKAPRMLEMLEELLLDLESEIISTSMNDTINRAKKLIKSATEL